MDPKTESVSLHPPLPCSIRKPSPDAADRLCGKPATAGWAWRPTWDYLNAIYPGVYLLQPVCAECARALQALYEKDA